MKIRKSNKKELRRFHDIHEILKFYLIDVRKRSLISNYRVTKKKKLLNYFSGYAKNPEDYWKIAPMKIQKYDEGINELVYVLKKKTKNQIFLALSKTNNIF